MVQLQSRALVASVLALALIVVAPLAAGAQDANQSDGSTALDPCQLVTSDEASALAGATYTTGVENTSDSSGSRTCVYGGQTPNVFMVTVAQAPDADTAQAYWAQYEAEAQNLIQRTVPAGVTVSFDVTDLASLAGADRAAVGQLSQTVGGRTINGSAIYLLKGASFVTFSDLLLDQPAPSNDALEAEAGTVLGRLP
jgi:hypothetical protein